MEMDSLFLGVCGVFLPTAHSTGGECPGLGELGRDYHFPGSASRRGAPRFTHTQGHHYSLVLGGHAPAY